VSFRIDDGEIIPGRVAHRNLVGNKISAQRRNVVGDESYLVDEIRVHRRGPWTNPNALKRVKKEILVREHRAHIVGQIKSFRVEIEGSGKIRRPNSDFCNAKNFRAFGRILS